jgi:hypothetical protein
MRALERDATFIGFLKPQFERLSAVPRSPRIYQVLHGRNSGPQRPTRLKNMGVELHQLHMYSPSCQDEISADIESYEGSQGIRQVKHQAYPHDRWSKAQKDHSSSKPIRQDRQNPVCQPRRLRTGGANQVQHSAGNQNSLAMRDARRLWAWLQPHRHDRERD